MLLDRSYFALQARFAARVVDIEGIDFGNACRLHTAFYALARDNDAGVVPERNDFDPGHQDWVAFLEAVDDGMDPVDYIYKVYLDADAQENTGTSCFDFTYWPEDRLVRVHFSNDRNGTAIRPSTADDRRPASRPEERLPGRRTRPSRCMRRARDVVAVSPRGVPAAVPPSFVSGMTSVGYPHQFAALWAQFIDRHGVVKPAMAATFLQAIETASTPSELDDAFPLDVLAATSEIDAFYDYFGVDQ